MKLVQASNDLDQILTTPTEQVTDFSEVPAIELRLRTAIRMNVDKDGNLTLVGLAANQIGIKKAVTVILIGHEDGDLQWITMVNPKITKTGGGKITMIEGCGSLREPEELYFDVTRHGACTVEYQNVKGEPQRIWLPEYSARVAQHEIDHLNGILISDIGEAVDRSAEE